MKIFNMKKRIKIHFTDFWKTFKNDDNFFYNLLKQHYQIELSPKDPDFLFYSVFGTKFEEYNCKRIMFSGENVKPDLSKCDYAFCFALPEGERRIYRLPQYYQYGNMAKLAEKIDPEKVYSEKTKFCNFIYSNPGCKQRNNFFKKLSKYKKVDSAGRFLNNIGSYLPEGHLAKREFLKPYKFTIAFENEQCNLYTSEKIFEAMYVNSIAVYWGNPLVHLDFNPDSFINWYDYGSDELLIEKIIELDNNKDKYLQMINQPFFHQNQVNEFVDDANILDQFDYIFSCKDNPVSMKSPVFKGNSFNRKFEMQKVKIRYKIMEYLHKIKRLSMQRVVTKIIRIITGY